MPLPIPDKAPRLMLHWITRGFCRALVAVADYKDVTAGVIDPVVARRAATAQSFLFTLGLEPWPQGDLTAQVKSDLVALVAALEKFRSNYDAVYQIALSHGHDVGIATATADQIIPTVDVFQRTLNDGGAVQRALNFLKQAFGSYDINGTLLSEIQIGGDRLKICRPPSTPLEQCFSMGEIQRVLDKQLRDAVAADQAAGRQIPDYGQLVLEPMETVDFREYARQTREIQALRAEHTAIYAPAPARAAGAPAASQSIYGPAPAALDFPNQDRAPAQDAFAAFRDGR